MVDSTTAVEIIEKGTNPAVFAMIIVVIIRATCKIKDLIFGDE